MENDDIAYTELLCGIPPEIFDLVQDCETAKEIWTVLENMFEGTDQARDKKTTSAINDYNNFAIAPNEF